LNQYEYQWKKIIIIKFNIKVLKKLIKYLCVKKTVYIYEKHNK